MSREKGMSTEIDHRSPPVTSSPYRRAGFCGLGLCSGDATDMQEIRRRMPSDMQMPKPAIETEVEVSVAQLRTEVAEQRRRLLQMEEHLKMVGNYKFIRPTFQRPADLSFSSPPNPSNRSLEESKARSLSPIRDMEEGIPREGDFTARHSTRANTAAGAGRVSVQRMSNPTISLVPKAEEQLTTPRGGALQVAASSKRRIFDQDLLKVIYDRPYRKARQSGALVTGGVLGLMSMPFGPIGMVAGGSVGALLGGAFGFWVDRRTARAQIKESEAQTRKLKSLVRWALDHFHEEDEIVELIEMVVLEFKPMADIADGSKHGRKMLKLLDGWIAQKKVTRNLWVYMDSLLQSWRELNRQDFLRSMRVFQTLTIMYHYSRRTLDEQEEQFVMRMQRLLDHESVKLVMAHAQAHPTGNETKLMECMVYADAMGPKKKKTVVKPLDSASPSVGNSINAPMLSDKGEDSESDDDDEEDSPNTPRSALHRGGLTPHASPSGNKGGVGGLNLNGLGPVPLLRSRSSEKLKDHSRSPRGIAGSPRESNQSQPGIARNSSTSSLSSRSKAKAEPKYVKQLKKPFFKGWDDFMQFDCSFKHKMPITYSEFDLVRQKSVEDLKGWDVCVDRKEIKVAKIQNDTGCITLRAWATVPGVDLMVAFFLFADHNERLKWDKIFAKMDVIEKNCQGSCILYSLMKVPAVTPRDFLQYRRCRIKEDGSIEIVLRSAVHPDMPDQKGAIRAESYIAGYVLTQTFDPDGTPVLNIFLMSSVDIKGLIPKWIINVTAPRKPAEWVETLKKAATDYQKQNPNYKTKLEDVLAPYREANPFDYEDVLVEDDHHHPTKDRHSPRDGKAQAMPIGSNNEVPVDIS